MADEIVVVDSGSEDSTVSIAKKFTVKVFIVADWQGYGVQKKTCPSDATGDWVLNIDADEVVDADLKQAIPCMKADNPMLFVYRTYVFLRQAYALFIKPKRHYKFIQARRGASYSTDIVMKKLFYYKNENQVNCATPFLPHCYKDISHLLAKINRYSSSSASIRISNNKKISLIKTLLGTSWMFFRCFLFNVVF